MPLAAIFAACANSAVAEDGVLLTSHTPTHLPAIVVEEERETPLSPSLATPDIEIARERIEQTPGGVDVIDAQEYKTGRTSNITDALKFSPGVYVQPRFGSEEARLSIRGSGIQRTFHLRGITLLQDDVPVNKADGSGDFQSIEPLATRYIEVYRGANALQHGSSTLGGAVNFVTPTGYDASPYQSRAEAGSFDYRRMQGSLAGAQGPGDYYLSLTHSSQEGFRDHAEQSTQRIFGSLGWGFTNDLESRLYLSFVTTDSELPGSLTKAEFEDDPEQAAPFNVIGDNKRDYDRARIAHKTVYRFGDSRIEGSLFYVWEHLRHPIFQVLDIENDDYGASVRFVNESEFWERENEFTLGFIPQRGLAKDDRFANILGGKGERTGQSYQTAEGWALYAENQHYLIPKLALLTGFQWAHAHSDFEDRFLGDGADNSFEKDYWGFNPKFGLRYELIPHNQVYTNLSRSFEPPTFGELAGGPNVSQNSKQTAWTGEIGTRGELDFAGPLSAVRWDFSYYHAEVDDELLSLVDPDTGLPFGTINAEETIHRGVELGLELEFLSSLAWRNAYLWNDFRFEDDEAFGDNDLAGIPEHILQTELVYRHSSGLYGGPNLAWSPKRFAVDHANTLFNDSYAVWGFKLGYRPHEGTGWTAFVDIRNLGDEVYAADTGVLAVADPAASRAFLPGDGRSVYAGVEWQY
jgi:iron complex outermembrane recepter protein